MKRLQMIICMLALMAGQAALSSTLVVSDVDDTIKITDVLNKKNMVYNALFNKAAFSGMAQLYRELEANGAAIYYISGSPSFIEEKVSGFLAFNKFPFQEHLILKNGLSMNNYDYKVSRISSLIDELKPEKVILIGDDTEFDPEAYQTIMQKYPGVVEAAYIRSVQHRKIPANDSIKSFFSAVEIAGHEQVFLRLGSDSLLKVAKSYILNDGSKISIKARYCPSKGSEGVEQLMKQSNSEEEVSALLAVQQKIVKTCSGAAFTSRSR